MIFSREKKAGIDFYIDNMQKRIRKAFDVDAIAEIYGRCYMVDKDGQKLPYWHEIGRDYGKDVLGNDSVTRCFFIEDDSIDLGTKGTMSKSTVYAFFFVKLEEDTQREDSVFRTKVLDAFRLSLFDPQKVVVGTENVMRFFNLPNTDNLKWSDMHPYHVFMVESQIDYLNKNNC